MSGLSVVNKFPVRVLVVDDYETWRRYFSTTLAKRPGLQIIGEATDGAEAVRKAAELQPDLITLDIGLPTLNGIEAGRRIREVSPGSKILFVSENRSPDIAQEALSTGAVAYIVKSDAGSDLLRAVDGVLEGKRFVSASLAELVPIQNASRVRHHEVEFYSDDREFLGRVARFLGESLKVGNAALVVATESHRDGLRSELHAYGVDAAAAIKQGRLIELDVEDTLSLLIVNDKPDAVRFLELFGDLIRTAIKAAVGAKPRVSAFGELAPFLWAAGNGAAAVQIEKLADELTQVHELDLLCGYAVERVQSETDHYIFHRICAEHSAVHPQNT